MIRKPNGRADDDAPYRRNMIMRQAVADIDTRTRNARRAACTMISFFFGTTGIALVVFDIPLAISMPLLCIGFLFFRAWVSWQELKER